MLRKIITSLLLATSITTHAQQSSFARGADISWCTEMEADGMKFYSKTGRVTDIFALMSQIGLNAIRLRVWVNPENEYGAWCDKADVVAKAKRAHAEGLDVMIDFHYSDNFADPGKQVKPAAWEGLSFLGLKKALANHTKDVLQALKDEGIEPRWVQVGNETTSGMVYDEGRIDWDKDESERWTGYVELSNAGYYAVKEVLPDAYVIVHHDKAENDNVWFYSQFRQYGGKFDMIGLSHYPDWDEWSETNTQAATNLAKLYDTFQVPVMIVETGYSNWDESRAESVMKDLFDKMEAEPGCAGILYWEPEVYGGWSHGNPGAYGKVVTSYGAFTAYGRPSKALLAFAEQSTDIPTLLPEDGESTFSYNLQGQKVNGSAHGIIIRRKDGKTTKIFRR